ncbi:Uncharacterised protein [uncultured archaeon]|nr:Uncharacterised protein [uncultured archaeon]
MAKLRLIYDIYLVKGPFSEEEYIETLEFGTTKALAEYLDKLRETTKQDYVGRISLLLVKDKEGVKT